MCKPALILLPLVLSVLPCKAEENSLYLGGWSTHVSGDSDYNENHRLIAIDHDDYVFGYARNSFDRDTFFLSHRFNALEFSGVKVELHVGAVYGYTNCINPLKVTKQEDKNSKLCPFVAPEVSPSEYWEIKDTGYSIKPSLLIVGNAFVGTLRVSF